MSNQMGASALNALNAHRQADGKFGEQHRADMSDQVGDLVGRQGPAPTVLSAEELTSKYGTKLASAPVFRKNVRIQAEQATEAGTVTTTLADGRVETVKDYAAGDWIVTNPGGEQYTMGDDKFSARYAATDEPGTFQSTGTVQAVQYTGDTDLEIETSWGTQNGAPGCWIAKPSDGNAYIIGEQEMADTYVPDAANAETTKRLMGDYVETDDTYYQEYPGLHHRLGALDAAVNSGQITSDQRAYLLSSIAQGDKAVAEYEAELGPASSFDHWPYGMEDDMRKFPNRALRVEHLGNSLGGLKSRSSSPMHALRVRRARKAIEKAASSATSGGAKRAKTEVAARRALDDVEMSLPHDGDLWGP